jgi:AcrR family transcriptional regulator
MQESMATQGKTNRTSMRGTTVVADSDMPSKRLSRAQRTREATRAKLIDAAGAVMADKGVEGTTIADITEAADVATGSFYNHFTSKTEIAEIIFKQHADELARVNAEIFARESDPATAIVYIQKIFLTKAVADPVWGWFVVHATTDLPQMSDVFAGEAAAHLRHGVDAGRLKPANVDAAVRIILVTLTAGMRDLLEGRAPPDWADKLIHSLLQMLGMPSDEAKKLAGKRLPAYVAQLFEH